MMIDREHLQPIRYPVIGFIGASAIPEFIIKLPVLMDENKDAMDVMMEFMVVDVPGA